MKEYRHIFVNILLALVWLCFVYINLTIFFQTPRLSALLFILAQSEFVILLLIRKQASFVTTNPGDYIVAVMGTFIALLFQPSAGGNSGDILIYLGVVFEISAFLSLNTSAGIVPANRGIKTRGLYKYVRHPIYASYLFLYAGYVINNPSLFNWAVLIAALVLQVWRIHIEEVVLVKDFEYREYSKSVRWHLVPGIY